ncbi:MAG: anhydro-N-acetylmuramic acid kinase [Bacteroidales bacterium]|nr:anhydro-N-acetylmuramic acid kinase [Bacteroidales bacterium]
MIPALPIIALGAMSGTSLDGLDLALCRFTQDETGWNYHTLHCQTFGYSAEFKEQLARAENMSALDFMRLDREFSEMTAAHINQFLEQFPEKPALIASHGQTIFHQPDKGLTVQIGNGAIIAARTGIPTVCDFRTTDVALGGQGAPLVPIGDKLLYHSYKACLNLGGFCNISFDENGHRMAFDISPCNMMLNLLASRIGHPFDNQGENARKGTMIPELLHQLNHLDYYSQTGAKSLGKEWFVEKVQPLLNGEHAPEDLLRTAAEHISFQIARILNQQKIETLLVTGGGAHNTFLLELIQEKSPECTLTVPNDETVDFKEAIIFAFLGVLRVMRQHNCLADVTGACRDNCGGAVYL